MEVHLRVLLVGSAGGAVTTLGPTLTAAGCHVTAGADFAEARRLLEKRPSVLISDLKLGAFNGLHLAIRAGGLGIPSIVIGDPDPVLEADARRYRVTYVTLPVDRAHLLGVVGELMDASRRA